MFNRSDVLRHTSFVVAALSSVACGLPSRPDLGRGGTSEVSAAMPSGTVVAFAGVGIPPGWTLCDGRSTPTGLATPDLRGRFVLGAVPGPELGESGGSETHGHSGATGTATGATFGVERDKDAFLPSSNHRHEVTIQPASHWPPFVKLVYIMKD